MQSAEAFIIVVDFDPRAALGSFIGSDPVELVLYLKALERMAAGLVEQCHPDSYEARLELHRVVWLKDNHNASELVVSLIGLISRLLHGTRALNAAYEAKGIPAATFHAGLSVGSIGGGAVAGSGEGVRMACACAEHARKTDTILVVTPEILRHVPAEDLERLCLDSVGAATGSFVAVREDALLRFAP